MDNCSSNYWLENSSSIGLSLGIPESIFFSIDSSNGTLSLNQFLADISQLEQVMVFKIITQSTLSGSQAHVIVAA